MATKRVMPIKMADGELGEEYEGWKFTYRTNPPVGILVDITSGDLGLIVGALGKIIVSWNFVDEKGKELGDPSESTVKLLSSDLLTLVAEKIAENIGKVSPN